MILWPGESRQPQPQPWTISWQYMGQLGMVSTTHSWWYWDGFWNWVYHITVFRSKVFFQLDYCRRKFRSQTSDNMDRWKSRGGKSQRGEEKKKEDQRRERGRRQRTQVREKVANSPVFFQWFVAPEGRKVGLLKQRVRSHLARWEMKSCTPFWRNAHFEVKMHKTHQVRSTFGSCDVQKVHIVVARSTFPSQNVQDAPGSKHFWKLRCPKSARRWGAKHMSKSKCAKHTRFGALLEVEMSLRWFCVIGAALCMTWHHFFVASATTLNRWNRKIATRIGTRPSALFSTFHVWRKSCRIASFFDVVNLQIWGSLAG